jgi:hypothetical protein
MKEQEKRKKLLTKLTEKRDRARVLSDYFKYNNICLYLKRQITLAERGAKLKAYLPELF